MTQTSGIQGITEADIANYLANTPGFFERHAELLASVQLTSPHGQRAVSLQERQMEMLRDKIRGLEGKIIEMIRHGQDNVGIAERLHRWTRALMLTPQPADLPEVLVNGLMHQFMIPQAGIRVWGAAATFAAQPYAQPVGDDVKIFAASLTLPYCGVNSGFEAAQWLDEPASAKSMALIPLRLDSAGGGATAAFGMLVLASPDPTRYTAEMGTEFLVRIGEIASAALSRVLPARA
ncbi:MAG: DUF484 family protein [Burkholderiales bacterium]|nr:DUF484 family protein [Burkholderiales bacterium]MDE2300151.1 DUF484 family protein [Burkholderiales bacterium]